MATNPERNGPAASLKLVISNVSKAFETKTQALAALAPVDLEIREGEFVVFVGPSGCGKTTLLNIIAGFIEPTTGELQLDGQRITRPDRDRLMMFQEPALFPWLNVLDNVSYGLKGRWFRRQQRRERARQFIRMVHLEQFEKAPIHELSGGMEQRVALARALAPDPKVLLIDEPFSALDAMTRLKLYGELQEVQQATKKTVVFVTHETQEAACLGDRVLIFSGRPGRILHEIRIDLPRPRDFNDPKVFEYSAEILSRLKSTSTEGAR
jgi:NitT/TauT family transport system ATP-binding protein